MNRKLSVGLLSLSFIAILSCLTPASAAYDVKRAILFPGNPLYFIKEFSRTVQRTLVVDAVSQAELELGIADSLASEILAIEEKDPKNLNSALQKYSEELTFLKSKIAAIEPGSDEQNSERFLEAFTQKLLAHDRLIGEVIARRVDIETEASSVRSKITEGVSFAEIHIGKGYKGSADRMKTIALSMSSPVDGISILDFVARLEDNFSGSFEDVKDLVVSKLSGMTRFDSSAMAIVLNKLSVMRPAEQRAKVVVDITERTSDVATADRLRAMESGIVSEISNNSAKREIEKAQSSASALAKFAIAFSSGDIMPRIDGLIEEAERLYTSGEYTLSFISARSAEVVASRYLSDLSLTSKDIDSKMQRFISEYGRLSTLAEGQKMTPVNSPVLWSKMGELKVIINTSITASSAREAEKIISEIITLIEK